MTGRVWININSKWTGEGLEPGNERTLTVTGNAEGVVLFSYVDRTGRGEEWFAGRSADFLEDFLTKYKPVSP